MLVFHVNTTSDADTLRYAYEGLKDIKVFVNPTRKETEKALKDSPNELAMFLGHGGSTGLFDYCHKNELYVLDGAMSYLLKDRETIGIWCHASDYARQYGCKGFFTSMFISNKSEAGYFHYKATDEKCLEEDIKFAKWVKELIEAGTPLSEWPEILRGKADMGIDFVNYNYSKLEYFDGTQKPPVYGSPVRFNDMYEKTETKRLLTDREWVTEYVSNKCGVITAYNVSASKKLTEAIVPLVIEKLGDKFVDDGQVDKAPLFGLNEVRDAFCEVICEKFNV